MDSKFLEQQIATMRQSLFNEEILSYPFTTLEEMEDVDDPNFVQTVAKSYLSESPNYIDTIEQTLEAIPLDLPKLDSSLHKFKGSSASIGANKVHIEIIKMLDCFEGGDIEGCKAELPSLKQEFDTLKNKLQAYLELLQQDRPGTSSSGAK